MARLAPTVVLLLSLLAVASCRVLEAEPESVVAISDERNHADPAVPQEADAAEATPSFPTSTVADATLQLPSHRRPCRHGFVHSRLRWARPHGLSHRRGALAGPGEVRFVTAFLPEEPREVGEELVAVAEPDPDSLPHTDGKEVREELVAVAEPDPDSLPHTDDEEVEEKDTKKPSRRDEDGVEENESVKAWKAEMLKRFRGHGLRFHHRHHRELAMAVQKDDGEDREQEGKEEGAGDMQLRHVRLFIRHFHHHHVDEDQKQQDKEEGVERVPVELVRGHFHHHHGDEQDETARTYFSHHHHHDSGDEVDEVEELAGKLSEAIKRRSLRRGGIRRQHHHHHHAEEGGVRKWFQRLINMNRF